MPYLIDVHAISGAPAERVFEHLAVAEAWGVWGRFPTRPVRERPGADSPNGTGAVRRIWPAREQVIEHLPPTHYAYVALSGIPIRNYRADVTLTSAEAGTAIRWQGRFDPLIPGTGPLIRAFLNRMLAGFARSLAAHSDRCEPGCPAYRTGSVSAAE